MPFATAPLRSAPGPAGLPYRVEVLEGRAALDKLAPEWDALVASGPADVPFVRHSWLAAWLDAFATDGEGTRQLRVLCARDASGAAVGFAPLLERRAGGATWLVAPANDHSCRVEWALGPDASGAVAALWAHLRDALRWDVLLLRDLPRDGPTSTLLEPLARADGHLTGRWASLDTPVLGLGGMAVEERTSAKFRANLRRRAKRLGELGAVAIERIERPADVDGALETFFALEAAGWKGANRTAIGGDPRLRAFYLRVARDAAAAGTLAGRALTLDGRAIAFHLGLVHRGTYYLPKTAYDEALSSVSPGQLLQREVVAECEARGLRELDFLGPDMTWKRDWEPDHRPHDWLYVYRPSLRGRAMYTLKHQVKPAVKEALARWR